MQTARLMKTSEPVGQGVEHRTLTYSVDMAYPTRDAEVETSISAVFLFWWN